VSWDEATNNVLQCCIDHTVLPLCMHHFLHCNALLITAEPAISRVLARVCHARQGPDVPVAGDAVLLIATTCTHHACTFSVAAHCKHYITFTFVHSDRMPAAVQRAYLNPPGPGGPRSPEAFLGLGRASPLLVA
jgi:hypothetical protein